MTRGQISFCFYFTLFIVALGLLQLSRTINFPIKWESGAAAVQEKNPLACDDVFRLAAWSGKRHGGRRQPDLRSRMFARRVLQQFIQKLDPNKLLFTRAETESFITQGVEGWRGWVDNRKCGYFDGWVTEHYGAAKARFNERLSGLRLVPPAKLLAGSQKGDAKAVYPHFKETAEDEKELTERMTKWVDKIGESVTSELLAAYQKNYRRLVTDTLDQSLFEEPPVARNQLAKSILAAMDPFSTYFSPSEFEEFYYDLAGGTSGIGIRIRKVPSGLLIEKILDDSPASQSRAIRVGDILVKVNDTTLENLPLSASRHLLQGPEGSSVKLELDRLGKHNVVSLHRQRFAFEEARITYRMMRPKGKGAPVAVIDVPSFYGRGGMNPMEDERSSSEDFKEVLGKLMALPKPPSAIVIDLRGNPGGFLEEAVTMAGFFIGNQPVVEVVENTGKRLLREEKATPLYAGPLVVLQDEGSASAAEVLAGALKDYKRAVVVGSRRSYGKGSVQRLFHLEDEIFPASKGKPKGGVVKLTTSLFYSPSGHSPANGGVTSQIAIETRKDNADEPMLAPALAEVVPEETSFLDEAELTVTTHQLASPRLVALSAMSHARVQNALAISRTDGQDLEAEEAAAIAVDWIQLDKKANGALLADKGRLEAAPRMKGPARPVAE